MIRVLHIIQLEIIAGAEIHLLHLLPSLIKNSVRVEVCFVLRKDNETIQRFIQKFEKNGIKTHQIESKHAISFKILSFIYSLSKQKFNIIHTHLIHAEIWMYFVSWFLPKKTKWITTKHGIQSSYIEKNGLNYNKKDVKTNYFKISRWIKKNTNGVIFVSTGLKKIFERANSICSKSRTAVIHHGINSTFSTAKNSHKKINNLLFLGRIEKRKGIQFIIKSLPKIIANNPEIKLNIVGNGSYKKELIQLSEVLKVNDYINWVGFSENPSKYLIKNDVLLVPSIGEPFGLVILEGFSHKIPVIANNVSAFNEIIEDRKTGLLINFEDKNNALSAIKKLEDKIVYTKIVKNAFDIFNNQFSVQKMAKRTKSFYLEVINES